MGKKSSLLNILLLAVILGAFATFTGCSRKGSSKIQGELLLGGIDTSSSGISYEAAVIWGKSDSGERRIFPITPGSDDFQAELPNGKWTFSAFLWSNLDGVNADVNYCATQTADLTGGEESVSFGLSKENCELQQFSGPGQELWDGNELLPTQFSFCSAEEYEISFSDPLFMCSNGLTKSFRLKIAPQTETIDLASVRSACVDKTAELQQVPWKLPHPETSGVELQMEVFTEHGCTGKMRTISMGVPDETQAHHSGVQSLHSTWHIKHAFLKKMQFIKDLNTLASSNPTHIVQGGSDTLYFLSQEKPKRLYKVNISTKEATVVTTFDPDYFFRALHYSPTLGKVFFAAENDGLISFGTSDGTDSGTAFNYTITTEGYLNGNGIIANGAFYFGFEPSGTTNSELYYYDLAGNAHGLVGGNEINATDGSYPHKFKKQGSNVYVLADNGTEQSVYKISDPSTITDVQNASGTAYQVQNYFFNSNNDLHIYSDSENALYNYTNSTNTAILNTGTNVNRVLSNDDSSYVLERVTQGEYDLTCVNTTNSTSTTTTVLTSTETDYVNAISSANGLFFSYVNDTETDLVIKYINGSNCTPSVVYSDAISATYASANLIETIGESVLTNLDINSDGNEELKQIDNASNLLKSFGPKKNSEIWQENILKHNGQLYFPFYNSSYGIELHHTDNNGNGGLFVDAEKTVTDGAFDGYENNTDNMIALDNTRTLVHATSETGSALWVTDGTTEGTSKIQSFPNSRYGGYLPSAKVNGGVVFTVDHNQYGRELWFTDGTSSGTYLLKDIVSGPQGSSPSSIMGTGNYAYFKVYDEPSGLEEVWVTDGTSAGTQRILQAADDQEYFTMIPHNGEALITTDSSGTYSTALYDHTGTQTNVAGGGNYAVEYYDKSNVLEYGGITYLAGRKTDGSTGTEPLVFDGATISLLKDTDGTTSGSYPSHFTVANDGSVYFMTTSTGHKKLYQTDGTSANTLEISDLATVTGETELNPTTFFATGTKGIMMALEIMSNKQVLVHYDGTNAPSTIAGNLYSLIGETNSKTYFYASDGTNEGLFRYEMGTGTTKYLGLGLFPDTRPMGNFKKVGSNFITPCLWPGKSIELCRF